MFSSLCMLLHIKYILGPATAEHFKGLQACLVDVQSILEPKIGSQRSREMYGSPSPESLDLTDPVSKNRGNIPVQHGGSYPD